jgi:hypothetical protein
MTDEVLFIAYAALDNLELWGFHDDTSASKHKQGKVPLGEPLRVVQDFAQWYRVLEPEHHTAVAVPYDAYWVRKAFVTLENPEPEPEPTPEPQPEPEDGDTVLPIEFRPVVTMQITVDVTGASLEEIKGLIKAVKE